MSCALALLLVLQSRLAWARYELHGPMSEPALELVAGSSTRLTGALLAGEHVERLLPVVVDPLGSRGEPRWTWSEDPDRAGRARFLGWDHEAEMQWSALPPGLRARPRPPVLPADTTPPLALFFLLGGAALASVGLARRGRLAPLVPSLAGCVLAWWFAGAANPGAPLTWTVFEGQGGDGPWIEVRAAWETLALPAEATALVLASEPEAAPISVVTKLAHADGLDLRAPGAALTSSRVCDPAPGRIDASGQDCADFEAVWWRAEGEWTYRGAWSRGQALPAARLGDPPPGWLMNGLPQGPRVCLARTAGPNPRWFRDLGP